MGQDPETDDAVAREYGAEFSRCVERACVRACVRICVRAFVRACVRACVHAHQGPSGTHRRHHAHQQHAAERCWAAAQAMHARGGICAHATHPRPCTHSETLDILRGYEAPEYQKEQDSMDPVSA